MKTTVVGRLDFGVSISVRAECLGQSIQIEIGEYRAKLVLPSVKIVDGNHRLEFPELESLNQRVALRLTPARERELWGLVHNCNSQTLAANAASLESVILFFENFPIDDVTYEECRHGLGRPNEIPELRQLWTEANTWVMYFRRWVGLLTGQFTVPGYECSMISVQKNSLSILIVNGSDVSLPSAGRETVTITRESQESWLGLDGLIGACDRANKKQEPNLALEFVQIAKASMWRKDYRKAVMEAGAAVG